MKRIYSIVLMATALFIGTNAWAGTTWEVGTTEAFENAWTNAASGDVIQLTKDVTIEKTLWLGTATMNGTARSLEIDLGGKNLTSSVSGKDTYAFVLTHGALKISNSGNAGQLTAYAMNVFFMTGSTNKDVDPSKDGVNYYTHLDIAKEVTVVHEYYDAAISIDGFYKNSALYKAKTTWLPSKPALDYATNVYGTTVENANKCVANGVRVDLSGTINGQKYGIKTNGYLANVNYYCTSAARFRTVDGDSVPKFYDDANATANIASYKINYDDDQYSPYVHIHSGARITVYSALDPAGKKNPIGVYASGYARWKVAGYVEGCNGAVVKSGEVDFSGAEVKGTGTTYNAATDQTSGTTSSGSAIVIQSSTAYAGDIDVTISGDTEVSSDKGYALEETVTTKNGETEVEAITITGGKFESGEAGTISITEKTAGTSGSSTIQITGGTIDAGTSTTPAVSIGGQTLNDFLTGQTGDTHATIVSTDDEGNTTVVISDGVAPAAVEDKHINTWTGSVNWKHAGDVTTDMEEVLGEATMGETKTLTLTELQISQNYNQKVIIEDGYTLEVGRVVMGAKAQIVVKPGAKLIITGAQGLAAFQESNIVLETSEAKQAIFLFNPAVTSNTHPMATVEFLSKSFVDGSNWAVQCFGIPTYEALTAIDAVDKNDPSVKVRTKFGRFNYAANAWEVIGEINSSNPAVSLSDMADPFNYYQMINYGTVMNNTKVIMKGKLVGNDIPQLNVRGNFWNGYANSCTAPMNINVLLSEIPNTVQKAIYLLNIDGYQTTWIARNFLNEDDEDMQNIAPLQPFLINNALAAANVEVSYEDAVYNPAMGIASAPARRAAANDNMTKTTLVVNGENCTDRVIVAENDEFSAEFDNGYDATKYMNDGINMYVSANEKMAIFATDNLNNTYVGLQTVKGGNYTIEFANVQGDELTLVDHETGARVAMVEGNTYEFTAAANSVNDYRFEIVASAKVPTAIENAETVKSAKGIYTITGQYMGEMNVWNSLPAGIYVIDGAKRVK